MSLLNIYSGNFRRISNWYGSKPKSTKIINYHYVDEHGNAWTNENKEKYVPQKNYKGKNMPVITTKQFNDIKSLIDNAALKSDLDKKIDYLDSGISTTSNIADKNGNASQSFSNIFSRLVKGK